MDCPISREEREERTRTHALVINENRRRILKRKSHITKSILTPYSVFEKSFNVPVPSLVSKQMVIINVLQHFYGTPSVHLILISLACLTVLFDYCTDLFTTRNGFGLKVIWTTQESEVVLFTQKTRT